MQEFGSKASFKMKRAGSLLVCICVLVMMNEWHASSVYFGNAGVALLLVPTVCVFWHAGFVHIPK